MAFRLKNRIMPKYKFINIKSVYSHMRLFFKNNYRRRLTLFILQNKRLRYKVRSARDYLFQRQWKHENRQTQLRKKYDPTFFKFTRIRKTLWRARFDHYHITQNQKYRGHFFRRNIRYIFAIGTRRPANIYWRFAMRHYKEYLHLKNHLEN